jgi:hypothetical protein
MMMDSALSAPSGYTAVPINVAPGGMAPMNPMNMGMGMGMGSNNQMMMMNPMMANNTMPNNNGMMMMDGSNQQQQQQQGMSNGMMMNSMMNGSGGGGMMMNPMMNPMMNGGGMMMNPMMNGGGMMMGGGGVPNIDELPGNAYIQPCIRMSDLRKLLNGQPLTDEKTSICQNGGVETNPLLNPMVSKAAINMKGMNGLKLKYGENGAPSLTFDPTLNNQIRKSNVKHRAVQNIRGEDGRPVERIVEIIREPTPEPVTVMPTVYRKIDGMQQPGRPMSNAGAFAYPSSRPPELLDEYVDVIDEHRPRHINLRQQQRDYYNDDDYFSSFDRPRRQRVRRIRHGKSSLRELRRVFQDTNILDGSTPLPPYNSEGQYRFNNNNNNNNSNREEYSDY